MSDLTQLLFYAFGKLENIQTDWAIGGFFIHFWVKLVSQVFENE